MSEPGVFLRVDGAYPQRKRHEIAPVPLMMNKNSGVKTAVMINEISENVTVRILDTGHQALAENY
jgi:hypothetical protein